MSILQYFKKQEKSSSFSKDSLPDPTGPLSENVLSKAIVEANEKVTKLLEKPIKSARGPYHTFTPAQKLTIGKRAAEHGTTAAMRFFAKKYPDLPLKETTVRRLKNMYQSQVRQQRSDISSPESFQAKKTGRPLLIGEDLDKQVRDYVGYLRSTGAVINTAVVIASAKGIIMYKDPNLLARINLTKGWAKYLLHRMGYVKRKATSKAKVTVKNFEELKEQFLLEINHVIVMDEILANLVINFDQTGLHFVPVSEWTMEAEGTKRVEVAGKDDKKQLTAVLGGSMAGEFLPPQLIYQGKTSRCLPSVEFPDDWHISYSINHWSNEGTMKEYVEHIPLPYINGKRKSLNLASNFPALVLFDNFKAQCTSGIFTLLDQNSINVVLIPPNCTDHLQPLDISVNKAVKDHLRGQFQSWYA